MEKTTVTGSIYAKIFELLEKHPAGLRWTELLNEIITADKTFHPKTVNGCIWKLLDKYPEKVYKPSRGLFRLLKYRNR
jgi:hypothetical protein